MRSISLLILIASAFIAAVSLPAAAESAAVATVTAVIPEQQFGLGRLELQGEGFGRQGRVTVGGVKAPIVSWGPTTIVARVPEALSAGRHPLRLLVGDKIVFEKFMLIKPRIVDIAVTPSSSGVLIRLAGSSLLGITAQLAGRAPRIVGWSNEELVMAFPPDLPPGMHRLNIDVAGHEMVTSDFMIAGEEVVVPLVIDALQFLGTQMRIQAAILGATGVNPPSVTVDGKPAKVVEWKPAFIIVELPIMDPGEHVVAFSSGGRTSVEKPFRLVFPQKPPADPRWDQPEFEESW